MKEEPTINYAFALKHYNQNGRSRSMKKFCEEEGYDYEKFMQYSRRGQKDSASSRRLTIASRLAGSSRWSWTECRKEAPASAMCVCGSRTVWSCRSARATSASCSAWSGRCLDSGAMVMMSSEYSIYLYREKVDLRKGISGLSGIVRDEMRLNPNTAKSVYVFSGRNFVRKSERNAGRGKDDEGLSVRRETCATP